LFVKAAEQEKEWAKYLFKDGSMIGLNEPILCQYVEFITNQRMKSVHLPQPYEERSNPLPWMKNWLESDAVQVAPQEVEVSSYLVGQIDSSVNSDEFLDFDL
jgi:ribonucleoside-diphosphate reductase beta chain